jgi:hypothetical protein
MEVSQSNFAFRFIDEPVRNGFPRHLKGELALRGVRTNRPGPCTAAVVVLSRASMTLTRVSPLSRLDDFRARMVHWLPQSGHVELDVSVSGVAPFLFLSFFWGDVGRAGHVFPLFPIRHNRVPACAAHMNHMYVSDM